MHATLTLTASESLGLVCMSELLCVRSGQYLLSETFDAWHASVGNAKFGAREVRNAGSETNAGIWSSITDRDIILAGNLLIICTTEAIGGGGSSSSQACSVTARRIPEEQVGSISCFPSNVLTFHETVSRKGSHTRLCGSNI